MEIRWLIDFLGVMAELWMLDFFCHRILGERKCSKRIMCIVYCFTGALSFMLSSISITAAQRTVYSFFVLVLPVSFFTGHFLWKVWLTVLFIFIHVGAEILCWAILSVMGAELSASFNQHTLLNYLQGITLSKLIAFGVIYFMLLVKRTVQYKQHVGQLSIYLLILLIDIGVIYQLAEASDLTDDMLLRVHFIITVFLLILASILLFYLLERHLETEQIRQQAALGQMQETMQREFYQLSAGREALVRGLRHDLQNHLAVVQSHLERQELEQAWDYLRKLSIEAEKSRNIVTGAASVDAILNIKKELIEAAQISFRCEIRQPFLLHLEEMDLVIVLANCLDNALEVAKQSMEIGQTASICLTLAADDQYVLLKVSNTALVPPRCDQNGHPVTTKEDAVQHGFGLKNVRRIVQRYQGTIEYKYEAEQFNIDLMLPNHMV